MKIKRDEGSILRTPDGRRWFARLRYTDAAGRSREKKRTVPTHAAAKAAIADLRLEIERDAATRKTYRELDVFYRREYVHAARLVGGQKVSGFRQPVKIVEHYLDAALAEFGDMYLDAIDFAAVESYKRRIASTPTKHGGRRSIADVNQHLRRLNRLLTVAVEQGWLSVNPFRRGKGLISAAVETERTRILTPADETRLLAFCTGPRAHLAAIVITAIETGMRRNEIRRLRWSAVDLSARVIRVDATTTKTLRPRMVPISERLRACLAALRSNALRPNSLVFSTGDFKRAFLKAVDLADLGDLHFHDLRHTAITRMLEAGIPPPLVMKISGHSQMKTFLRYVNQSESSMLDLARILDRAAA